MSGKYIFKYSATCLHKKDYAEHSGMEVTIKAVTGVHRASGDPLYKIEAADGWTGFAFGSELKAI